MIGDMPFRAICTVFTALLLLGCNETQPATHAGPRLRYVATGLDQQNYPLAFALKIANDGNAPATVDDVRFNVPFKLLLYDDDAGEAPSGFDCEVQVLTELPVTVQPGQTADLAGLVTWAVPPETPPMLAVVRARFQTLHNGKATIDQEPLIMFLQSRPGAVDAVVEAAGTKGEIKEVLGTLWRLDGQQSAGFNELLHRIEAAQENGK
jgi:hypothetical protein